MFGIATSIFALVSLVLFWPMGDAEFRTKVIFTVIYLLTVGWAFLEPLTGMLPKAVWEPSSGG
jgi:hypothetical protein